MLTKLWKWPHTWWTRRETVRVLLALSDEQLQDIGLERGGVRDFVDELLRLRQQPQPPASGRIGSASAPSRGGMD